MKKVNSEMFITNAEMALIKKRERLTTFANEILSIMEESKKEYRCCEIADILNKNYNRKAITVATVVRIFKKFLQAGLVVRVERNGDPIEIGDNSTRNKVVIDKKTYYYGECTRTKTIIPKIAYYSLA